MRKLTSALLLFGMLAAPVALASMGGCGGSQDEAAQVRPNPPPQPPPPPTPEPKPVPGPPTGDPPPDKAPN